MKSLRSNGRQPRSPSQLAAADELIGGRRPTLLGELPDRGIDVEYLIGEVDAERAEQ
jgi:hypothetical protein